MHNIIRIADVLFSAIECKQDVFWGDNCVNTCNCGGGYCDHRTGKCTCPAGKTGHHCEHGTFLIQTRIFARHFLRTWEYFAYSLYNVISVLKP